MRRTAPPGNPLGLSSLISVLMAAASFALTKAGRNMTEKKERCAHKGCNAPCCSNSKFCRLHHNFWTNKTNGSDEAYEREVAKGRRQALEADAQCHDAAVDEQNAASVQKALKSILREAGNHFASYLRKHPHDPKAILDREGCARPPTKYSFRIACRTAKEIP